MRQGFGLAKLLGLNLDSLSINDPDTSRTFLRVSIIVSFGAVRQLVI